MLSKMQKNPTIIDRYMHGKLLQKYSHAAEHLGVKTEKKKKKMILLRTVPL